MSKINAGFAFHCHHDVLVEYVHDYDERANFIINHKPSHEQELRLRLFKMIPADKLPSELADAIPVEVATREARNEASKIWGFIMHSQEQPSSQQRRSYKDAVQAYDEAAVKCVLLVGAYLSELNELHDSLIKG